MVRVASCPWQWSEKSPWACADSWCALVSCLPGCSVSCQALMLKPMTGKWCSILVPRSVLQNSIHHLPPLLILPFLSSHQLCPEPLLSFFIYLVFWPPLSRHFAPTYHTPQEASCLSVLHSCHRGNKISCRNKCQAFSLLGYDRLSDSLGCGISPGFSVTASSQRHTWVLGQASSTFLILLSTPQSPKLGKSSLFLYFFCEMLFRCILLV